MAVVLGSWWLDEIPLVEVEAHPLSTLVVDELYSEPIVDVLVLLSSPGLCRPKGCGKIYYINFECF